MIDKIVLNLANHPWPHFTGKLRRSAPNVHRLMYPLAKGKVVLSERSGVDMDEEYFESIVTFVNTSELFDVALELARDKRRRKLIEQKSLRFMASKMGLMNENIVSDPNIDTLEAIRDGLQQFLSLAK